MFTFSLLYLFIYYQLLILIFLYIYIYVGVKSIQQYSLSSVIFYIKNYNPYSNKFMLIALMLSGLPPVSFFLIKLSFLIKILSNINLTLQLLFFMNFLLGMFFYLQLFNITITNKTDSNFLKLASLNKNLNIINSNTIINSKQIYSYWVLYFTVLILNISGIFIVFDIYLIFSTFN